MKSQKMTAVTFREAAWDIVRRVGRRHGRGREARQMLWALGAEAEEDGVVWDGAVLDGVKALNSYASCRVHHSWVYSEVARAAGEAAGAMSKREICTLLWSLSWFPSSTGSAAFYRPVLTPPHDLTPLDCIMLLTACSKDKTQLDPLLHEAVGESLRRHDTLQPREAATIFRLVTKLDIDERIVRICAVCVVAHPGGLDRVAAVECLSGLAVVYHLTELYEANKVVLDKMVNAVLGCLVKESGALRGRERAGVLANLLTIRTMFADNKKLLYIVQKITETQLPSKMGLDSIVSILFFAVRLNLLSAPVYEAALRAFQGVRTVPLNVFSRLVYGLSKYPCLANDTSARATITTHLTNHTPHLAMNGRELSDTTVGLGGYLTFHDKKTAREICSRVTSVLDELSPANCVQIMGYLVLTFEGGDKLKGDEAVYKTWRVLIEKVKTYTGHLRPPTVKIFFYLMMRAGAGVWGGERELLRTVTEVAMTPETPLEIQVFVLNCLTSMGLRSAPLLNEILSRLPTTPTPLPPIPCARLLHALSTYPLPTTHLPPAKLLCTYLTHHLRTTPSVLPPHLIANLLTSLHTLGATRYPWYTALEGALHARGAAELSSAADGLRS